MIQYFIAIFFLNTDLEERDSDAKDAFSSFEKVMNSLSVMMEALMLKMDIEKSTIDLYVKMFLTSSHNFFDKYSPGNCKTDFWTKGNFISLTNLGSQIRRFGPLWLYWDGNNERFVHIPKEIIENLRKTDSYLKSKMTIFNKLNMIRYYFSLMNPSQKRFYEYGFHVPLICKHS